VFRSTVHRSASDKDIRAAYKRLSKKWHPDKNKSPGAEEKFVEIARGASFQAFCPWNPSHTTRSFQRMKCCRTRRYANLVCHERRRSLTRSVEATDLRQAWRGVCFQQSSPSPRETDICTGGFAGARRWPAPRSQSIRHVPELLPWRS